MDTWYAVDLGDGLDAFEPTKKIMDAFMAAYIVNGGKTNDMAAFSRYDLERNVVAMYFTPAAQTIAKAFNASPCGKPKTDRLGLILR
jgi:hypothetical protein